MDASETAQTAVIERTFTDIKTQHPSEIRHPDPKKRDLRVVDVCLATRGQRLISRHSTSCRMLARGRINTSCSGSQNGLPLPQRRCVARDDTVADGPEPFSWRFFSSSREGIPAAHRARRPAYCRFLPCCRGRRGQDIRNDGTGDRRRADGTGRRDRCGRWIRSSYRGYPSRRPFEWFIQTS